jgi:hypothetical protein
MQNLTFELLLPVAPAATSSAADRLRDTACASTGDDL